MATTLPTFQDLYDAFRSQVQLRRPDLTDFNEGSVLDAMAGGGAVLGDEVIYGGVQLFAKLFFDTAEGDDLDALALDRYGSVGARLGASASIGTLQWTRVASGSYTIPAGTRFQATTGDQSVTVQSTSAVAVLTTDTVIDVPCECTVTGRFGNLAAESDWQVLDVVSADSAATVANAQPFAGGSEDETDDAYRDRLRRIYTNLRKGTAAALEDGARSIPGVAIVTVDEGLVDDGGVTNVYIGDPDARSNNALAALVDAVMVDYRACGCKVVVLGSEREELDLSIRLTVEPGADTNAVGAAVRASVVAYGDTLQPGKDAHKSRIEQACHNASELVIAATTLTSLDDLTPSAGENAIRFTTSRIALSYRFETA